MSAAARRYAEALADVAFANGTTVEVEVELRAFAELFSTNRELREAFASPVVSRKDKKKVLGAIIDRTKPSGLLANLLHLLLRNYRLHQTPDVYREFKNEINKRGGVIPAEVTTASRIGPEEQRLLVGRLEQITGSRIEAKFKEDPALLGGAITRVGSVVYDGSIRTRLERIKRQLKEEGGAS
jgi:F-type H+-transporting ATPase subunit delta